jgi:hypothetical protein
MKAYDINLASDPALRWVEVGETERKTIRAVLDAMGVSRTSLCQLAAMPVLMTLMSRPEYVSELSGLAMAADVTLPELIVANAAYDYSFVADAVPKFGCTSLSVWTGDVFFHYRTLDWGAATKELRKATRIIRFERANRENDVVTTLGFPGLIGVLTAVNSGKFGATLNRAPKLLLNKAGIPSLLNMREVALATSYEDAVNIASRQNGVSDSFIHLTGMRHHQATIVSRTGNRSSTAVRLAQTNNEVKRDKPVDDEFDSAGRYRNALKVGKPAFTAGTPNTVVNETTVYSCRMIPAQGIVELLPHAVPHTPRARRQAP